MMGWQRRTQKRRYPAQPTMSRANPTWRTSGSVCWHRWFRVPCFTRISRRQRRNGARNTWRASRKVLSARYAKRRRLRGQLLVPRRRVTRPNPVLVVRQHLTQQAARGNSIRCTLFHNPWRCCHPRKSSHTYRRVLPIMTSPSTPMHPSSRSTPMPSKVEPTRRPRSWRIESGSIGWRSSSRSYRERVVVQAAEEGALAVGLEPREGASPVDRLWELAGAGEAWDDKALPARILRRSSSVPRSRQLLPLRWAEERRRHCLAVDVARQVRVVVALSLGGVEVWAAGRRPRLLVNRLVCRLRSRLR